MTRLPTSQQRIFQIEDEFKEFFRTYLNKLKADDVDSDEHEDIIDLVAAKIMNVNTTKEELKAEMKELYPDSAGKIANFTWEELERLGGPTTSSQPAAEAAKSEVASTDEDAVANSHLINSQHSESKCNSSSASPERVLPESQTDIEEEIPSIINLSPPKDVEYETVTIPPPLTYPPVKSSNNDTNITEGSNDNNTTPLRAMQNKFQQPVQVSGQHHHHHPHNHHQQQTQHHQQMQPSVTIICMRRHPDEATGFNMEERQDGVYLTHVKDNSPASHCGMQPHVGRRIVQLNNTLVKRVSDCMVFSRSPVLTFHFDMNHPLLQFAQQRKPQVAHHHHHHHHNHNHHHHHHHHHHNHHQQRAQQILQQQPGHQRVPPPRLPQRPGEHHHHHHHHSHHHHHHHHGHHHNRQQMVHQHPQKQQQRPPPISIPQQKPDLHTNVYQTTDSNLISNGSVSPPAAAATTPTASRLNIERQLNNEIETKKEELIHIQEKRERKARKYVFLRISCE